MQKAKALRYSRGFVNYWKNRLGLTTWRIEVVGEEPPPDDPHVKLAHVEAMYERERAEITVFYPNLNTIRQIGEVIFHEMMHLLLSPLDPATHSILYANSNEKEVLVGKQFLMVATETTVRNLEKAFEKGGVGMDSFIWTVENWLNLAYSAGELGVDADTTDAEIETLAARLSAEAKASGVPLSPKDFQDALYQIRKQYQLTEVSDGDD